MSRREGRDIHSDYEMEQEYEKWLKKEKMKDLLSKETGMAVYLPICLFFILVYLLFDLFLMDFLLDGTELGMLEGLLSPMCSVHVLIFSLLAMKIVAKSNLIDREKKGEIALKLAFVLGIWTLCLLLGLDMIFVSSMEEAAQGMALSYLIPVDLSVLSYGILAILLNRYGQQNNQRFNSLGQRGRNLALVSMIVSFTPLGEISWVTASIGESVRMLFDYMLGNF